jgi:uncharacterized protein YbjQ (UPF0145 family)
MGLEQSYDFNSVVYALVACSTQPMVERLPLAHHRSPPKRRHLNSRKERPVLITTTNDVAGYRVDEVFGEVFGLTVRSRHVGSQMGAAFKSLAGGELKGMTKNLEESRLEALSRLTAAAEAMGANAIIAMRFDTTEMGGTWTEICAYGTAGRLTKE